MRYFILISFYFFIQSILTGQEGLLVRQPINDCSIYVGSDMIAYSSLKLISSDSSYSITKFSIQGDTLFINDSICDQLPGRLSYLEYRKFPFNLRKNVALLDSNRLTYIEEETYVGYVLKPFEEGQTNTLFNSKGLNYNGSFARGFSVGNNQSFVVNSNFNLQLAGDLGNGLKIAAAISDENIPIQPEGNTQVLQEFDRVFIEVSKGRHSIVAGDFVLRRPQSYFINYQKKLKGLGGITSVNLGEKATLQSNVNVASSRGKFARQILEVKEGNQGPYRLSGNNNERFIILLSGTEKVFFNGILLQRGLDNDYIIDYNTADIIFSPKILISKETRIIVEFEYTDQNYFRSLYSMETNIAGRKYDLNVNFYSEQDSKTSTSQIQLGSEDIDLLERSGDRRAIRSGIRSVESNNLVNQVGYRLVKNPNFPLEQEEFILEFTPDKDSIEVVSTFTEVGQGEGSYIISQQAAVNGRVYQYVGQGLGNYDPVIELIAPEMRRMMSIGGRYRVNANTTIKGEMALSDIDLNRFSNVDGADDIGLAGSIGYETLFPLDSSKWTIFNKMNFESTQKNFNPLNPYRVAEFARDWNTSLQFEDQEALFDASLGLQSAKGDQFIYNFNTYRIASLFQGIRHGATLNYRNGGFRLVGKPNLTITKGEERVTRFYRPNFEISQSIKSLAGLTFGVWYEGEVNEIKLPSDEGFLKEAYSFDYVKSYIRTNPEKSTFASVSYNRRVDRFSDLEAIVPAIDIDEIEVSGGWKAGDYSDLQLSLKTRDFEILEPSLVPNETSKRTILGGLQHQFNLWKGALITATNYQLNSGQEPKQEFVFERVENVQGEYVYVGPDTATTLSINDFRYDPTNPLAEYVRILIPNNEFIRTNNLVLNQNIKINPSRYLKSDTSSSYFSRNILSKLSSISNVRILNKTMDESGEAIDPLAFAPPDSNLVSFSSIQTHALFWNRANPSYDISFTYRNNGNRINQINGYEQRILKERELRWRWNIYRALDIILTGSQGTRSYDSELFNDRDFEIDFIEFQPEINWRIGTQMRIGASYTYDQRLQRINAKEQAFNNRFSLNYLSRQKDDSSLNASISYVNVNFIGERNTPIEFDVLEGLKDGENFLWECSYTRRLVNNIDLSLTYSGRKTGDAPSAHVGRVQAKATF